MQVARVVPVVEVPAEALEAGDGGQRRLEPLDHLERPDPAEVARGEDRQQVEPDVRRRRAVGDDGLGVLLEVVGRQRVVVRADEGLEEPPRAAADEPERAGIGG